uniref:Uncharacterized protein n=2 Tax=Helianthus annuus TaxID=4232 RepID=A0A251RXM3_HELAN
MTVIAGVIVIRRRRLLMMCPVKLSQRRIKRCRLILIFLRLLMNLNLMMIRTGWVGEGVDGFVQKRTNELFGN